MDVVQSKLTDNGEAAFDPVCRLVCLREQHLQVTAKYIPSAFVPVGAPFKPPAINLIVTQAHLKRICCQHIRPANSRFVTKELCRY